MKYILSVLICLFISATLFATTEDWGRNGHRATGEIAQQHLSKKAKRNIKSLLNGESLAMASTFADEIKSDPRYRAYGPWHYVNFPFDSTYEATEKNPAGDIIVAIEKCVSVLKDNKATKEDKVFHLKLLVHFIGDLHQPLHIGLADDKGGNDFQVRWFNDGTNLHSVWDTKMIEDFEMSYSELASNSAELSETQLEAIKKGSVIDWMYDSRTLCKKIYATTEVGEKLGYNYMYDYVPVVREQLQKGGIRLATLLNEIFG